MLVRIGHAVQTVENTLLELERIKELLGGADALLRRPAADNEAAVRKLVAEARHVSEGLAERLEEFLALSHERERVHGQAPKHVGAEVPR